MFSWKQFRLRSELPRASFPIVTQAFRIVYRQFWRRILRNPEILKPKLSGVDRTFLAKVVFIQPASTGVEHQVGVAIFTHFVSPSLGVAVNIWLHLGILKVIDHEGVLWKTKALRRCDIEPCFCTRCFFRSIAREVVGRYLQTSCLRIANLVLRIRVLVPSIFCQFDNNTAHAFIS